MGSLFGSNNKKVEKPVPPPPPPVPAPAPSPKTDTASKQYLETKSKEKKGRASTILSTTGYGFKLSDTDQNLGGTKKNKKYS